MDKTEYWEEVQQKAKNDDRLLGLFLGGSRGKSEKFVREASDYDVHFVVRDEAIPWFEEKFCGSHEAFDFVVQGYEEFKEEDTPYWARYNFENNQVIIDKADIQGLVDAKARIPEDRIDTFVERQLDGYINYVYRSLKCVRDGLGRAARLEANRGINYGLKAVFAIHNGRTLPYYKYLEWELSEAGLERLDLSAKRLLTI